jgi:hypothetical protein
MSANLISREFVLAGKAIFTVSNDKGEHYTFRVHHAKSNIGYSRETWFAGLLTGPDNGADYQYVGIVQPNDGGVKLTAASRLTDDSKPIRVLRWALKLVWTGGTLPAGYAVQHAGRCGKCGRLLTHPESLETGIGPECSGRGYAKTAAKKAAAAVQVAAPTQVPASRQDGLPAAAC